MKTPIVLPAAGSHKLQLSARLSEKIGTHLDPGSINHRSDKLKNITTHGNSLSYKIGDQVMEE